MGAGLVRAAIVACGGVDHAPARLFIGMANSAVDADPAPVYFRGEDDMSLILGRAANDASGRAVRNALAALKRSGHVRSVRSAPGRRARHFLLNGALPDPQPLQAIVANDGGRSPSTDIETADSERPVSNRTAADAQRPVYNPGMADAQPRNGGRSVSKTADTQRPLEEERGGKRKQHANEPNAIRALSDIQRSRRLALSANELLTEAYRIGDGDPWNGYLSIKAATEVSIAGARNPGAVLRARLREINP